MTVGIMGALLEEVRAIVSKLDDPSVRIVGRRKYWKGKWHDHDVVVVVFSGMGKVASAAAAAILIAKFKVTSILFVGLAGSAGPSVRLGDVVLATKLLQHDMDASALPPFARFEVPLTGRVRFETDPSSTALAARAAEAFISDDLDLAFTDEVQASFGMAGPRVRQGLVASGDCFVGSAAKIAELKQHLPDLLCVEMEGAAVAQVCFELAVPLVVLRLISDAAKADASAGFGRFLDTIASGMIGGITDRIVRASSAATVPPPASKALTPGVDRAR